MLSWGAIQIIFRMHIASLDMWSYRPSYSWLIIWAILSYVCTIPTPIHFAITLILPWHFSCLRRFDFWLLQFRLKIRLTVHFLEASGERAMRLAVAVGTYTQTLRPKLGIDKNFLLSWIQYWTTWVDLRWTLKLIFFDSFSSVNDTCNISQDGDGLIVFVNLREVEFDWPSWLDWISYDLPPLCSNQIEVMTLVVLLDR